LIRNTRQTALEACSSTSSNDADAALLVISHLEDWSLNLDLVRVLKERIYT